MKADSYEQLIKKYNPFGVKDDKGEVELFADYGKLYLHVLKKIKEWFPRGYIDVPILMHKLTRQPLSTCEIFAVKSNFLKTVNRGVFLCEPVDGKPPKEKYANLMKAFHTLSETSFSQDYFNWAWEEFINAEDTE